MAIKSIQLNSFVQRIPLIIVAILCILAAYFALRWGFGHTIAQHTDLKEIAEFSSELAPYDSQTYLAQAEIDDKSFIPEDFSKALDEYEKAVSVSPNDFRLWLALGKARERTSDGDGAEKALRKASELAPNYSEVSWALGNTLLRQGNTDEAFAQIRKAVEEDPAYANPAVFTAWQTFDGNISQISEKIGSSAAIKAGLAPFLIKQQKFDEAFAFWNSLPENEKATIYKKNGEELVAKLLEIKKFREALTVQSQLTNSDVEKFTVGNIYNGDFEKNIKATGASIFDWQIADGAQPQIGIDNVQKHGGSQSLVILFSSTDGKEFRSVQQTVVVESGKNYKLETYYRSDLNALSTVRWEIVDAVDGKLLAATDAAAPKSSDWTALSIGFTTLPTTQAVIIRLGQVPCKQSLCPISGKIWFDDLSLK